MLRILSNCYFSWRTLKDVNNIFVSDFSFLTFLRYYHHIAQHYSQVQEYKVFVTTISADIFFLPWLTFFCRFWSLACWEVFCQGRGPTGCHWDVHQSQHVRSRSQGTYRELILILSFLKKSRTENKFISSVFTLLFLKLAVQCMTQEEVAVIYISQAQELEAQGKYKEAERWFTLLSIPDCRLSLPILPRLPHPTTIPPSLRLTRFFTCDSEK